MKKIDLGQTITILANIGVIAGIAFLAVELQQNNEILEAQMRFNQNERVTEVTEEFFRNPDLRRAFAKYVSGMELDTDEALTLDFYAQRIFLSINYIFREVQRGTMPQDVMDDLPEILRAGPWMAQSTAFYLDYWERFRTTGFDPEFVKWMSENAVN